MFVQTERPAYYSGDMVNAMAYINVITPFHCEGLEIKVALRVTVFPLTGLQISGREHSYFTRQVSRTVTDSNGNSRTETHTETYSATNFFFDVTARAPRPSPQHDGDAGDCGRTAGNGDARPVRFSRHVRPAARCC